MIKEVTAMEKLLEFETDTLETYKKMLETTKNEKIAVQLTIAAALNGLWQEIFEIKNLLIDKFD